MIKYRTKLLFMKNHSTFLQEVAAALISRTIDTSAAVLEALYSKPSALLPHLQEGYLEAVATVLSSPATPRQLIRLHLAFLSHHFVKTYPNTVNVVVERCLWPFLLFTKAKQKTSSAVWDILESEGCADKVTNFQLLRGCLAVVRELEQNFVASHNEGNPDSGLQKLTAIDVALASRIAGVSNPSPTACVPDALLATDNIILSENPLDHVDFVLGILKDENHNARALGYLVTRALLGKLSGQHQLSVAQRAIQAMGIETLSGMEDFMKGSSNLQSVRPCLRFSAAALTRLQFIGDFSLVSCVVHKPGSTTTLNRMKIAILTLVPIIPRPMNYRIDWFNQVAQPDEDTRGTQYVTLMATVYTLANAASTLPLLSAYLLRALFISLKDDALLFLAGVWSFGSKDQSTEIQTQIQLAALSHASAFLTAYECTQGSIDFQTILPPILAMVGSTSQPVRAAAIQCLSALGRLSQAGKPKAVYAFDSVYGARSGELNHLEEGQAYGASPDQLQFLDWVDFQRYALVLVDQSGHLTKNVDHLTALHHQLLTKHKSDSKKDSGSVETYDLLTSH